jgi:hypothetical protein
MRRCVFLDRDGVINFKPAQGEYIRTWREFRLISSVVDWIRLFNALDLLVIVVTNQRGVALGYVDPGELARIHDNMNQVLLGWAPGSTTSSIACTKNGPATAASRVPGWSSRPRASGTSISRNPYSSAIPVETRNLPLLAAWPSSRSMRAR